MSNVPLTDKMIKDLNKRLEDSGLTQGQLADLSNMSYGNTNAILNGRRTLVREESLAKLNTVLTNTILDNYGKLPVDSSVEQSTATDMINKPDKQENEFNRTFPHRVNALDDEKFYAVISYMDKLLDEQYNPNYSGH